ncbi:MAG: hypothetical protein LUD81_07840 [Clostridiales bacterium]|nr:hypothetical protein [Clostridiales bacterium]
MNINDNFEFKNMLRMLSGNLKKVDETVERLRDELNVCHDVEAHLTEAYEKTESDYIEKIKQVKDKTEELISASKDLDEDMAALRENEPKPAVYYEEEERPFLILFKVRRTVEKKDYTEVNLWEDKIKALEAEKDSLLGQIEECNIKSEQIRSEYEKYADEYTAALKEYEKAVKYAKDAIGEAFKSLRA